MDRHERCVQQQHSYYNESLVVIHEAHVEARRTARTTLRFADQPGCTVGNVYLNATFCQAPEGKRWRKGVANYKNITFG